MSMLNKALPISLLLFFIVGVTHAQAIMSQSGGMIYLDKNEDESGTLPGKRGGYFGEHPFGYGITKSFDAFMHYYVSYVTESGAYATEKKVIDKPDIYNAVMNIDKELKKQARKGEIPQSQAADRLEKVLTIAVKVRMMETTQLENVLDNAKTPEQMEDIFNNIRFEE